MNTLLKVIHTKNGKAKTQEFHCDGDMLTAIYQCGIEASIDYKYMIKKPKSSITCIEYIYPGRYNGADSVVAKCDKDGVVIILGTDTYYKKIEEDEPETKKPESEKKDIEIPSNVSINFGDIFQGEYTLTKAIVYKDETEYEPLNTYDNVYDLLNDAIKLANEDYNEWFVNLSLRKYRLKEVPLRYDYVIPVKTNNFSGELRIATVSGDGVVKVFIGNNILVTEPIIYE